MIEFGLRLRVELQSIRATQEIIVERVLLLSRSTVRVCLVRTSGLSSVVYTSLLPRIPLERWTGWSKRWEIVIGLRVQARR